MLDVDKFSDVMVTAVDPLIKSVMRRVDAFEAALVKRVEILEASSKSDLDIKAMAQESISVLRADVETRLGGLENFAKLHEEQIDHLTTLAARPPSRGEKGDKGDAGERGDDGVRGEDGIPGERGEKGERGDAGAQGEHGERGERGEKGEAGERGEPGERGEKGEPGKDADPQEIAAILEPVIGTKLAELVQKAISELPAPKDGRDGVGIITAWVDAEGKLSMTLSDGSTHVVGPVRGNDGRDGRDGQPGGPQGSAGPSGPPGNDGKSIEYLGTWDREKTYVEGNLTTWDGSMWSCKQETAGEMPGRTDVWVLVCKKGTPGREGRGIKSAKVDSDGQLVITYTDDTVQKAGRVRGDTGRPGRDFEPI